MPNKLHTNIEYKKETENSITIVLDDKEYIFMREDGEAFHAEGTISILQIEFIKEELIRISKTYPIEAGPLIAKMREEEDFYDLP